MKGGKLDLPCQEVLNQFFDGVYVVDRDRKILFWNASAEKITGYSSQDVLGKCCADNILRHVTLHGKPLCEDGCPLQATLLDAKPRSADVYLHHKAGHRVPVSVRSSPLYDEDGSVWAVIEIFSDNSRHEAMFRQLKSMERSLYQDDLTGIGNRKFAEIRLSELLGAQREHGQTFGLLFVDIDYFKRVNDTYGHQIGDSILQLVARTLQNGLRPTDRVCRFGGEEFICLLPNVDRDDVLQIAERVRMLVERSWLDTALGALSVSISVGGTLCQAGDTSQSVVERADRAMYLAKEQGRNCVIVD